MNLSVIICTHNPRVDYLYSVLNALQQQTLSHDQWELILVDNASQDVLSEKFNLSWHPHSRHVRETKLGLTQARLRGIDCADTELILFLDDDNIPSDFYLEKVIEIARDYPNLGVWAAGSIKPKYEQAPRSEVIPYVRFLALRTVDADIWKNQPREGPLPWGAGLVVRKDIANQYAENTSQCKIRSSLGRKGKSLLSCEDDEFSWTATVCGLGFGIFKELSLTHLIPKERIQPNYVERIAHGNGFSCALSAHIHNSKLDNPFRTPSFRKLFYLIRKIQGDSALREILSLRNYWKKPSISRTIEKARSDGWDAGCAHMRTEYSNPTTVFLQDQSSDVQ